MEAFEEVLDAAGAREDLARALGVPADRVRQWRRRGRIPARHWRAVVRAAVAWDPPRVVTLDDLCRMEEARAEDEDRARARRPATCET